MQSICLEGLGGENLVDPRLQETTFIQHTFGGRLKSKVFTTSMHLSCKVLLCDIFVYWLSAFSTHNDFHYVNLIASRSNV